MQPGTIAVSCLFASTLIVAHGSTSRPIHLTPQSPNTRQGLEGGFWRTDNNFDPILHLKNVLLKQPLEVTPTIFLADGAEFPLPPVHIAPAGVASVDLGIALRNVPANKRPDLSDHGMVAISYRWSWPAVVASVQDTDEIASLSNVSSPLAEVNLVHRTPEEASIQTVRGTWWRPTRTSDEVIALGNTSLSAKQVRVLVSDHLGKLLTEQKVTLTSHSTVLLHLNDLLSDVKEPGAAGDLTFQYFGASHAVVASASIEDGNLGYSVTPHMVERNVPADEAVHDITLAAPGVMLGKADPAMLFPSGTEFAPYAVLHNLSDHSISVQLALNSDGADGRPSTRTLDRIELVASESVRVDMSRYFDNSHPLPNGYGHLTASLRGRNEDLLFDTGSADQSGTYVFQVMPAVETSTISKIFCYWTVDGDSSTMISIWNYAEKPQDSTLTLYYSGGSYRIPIHLDGHSSFNLDTMTLIRSRRPDVDGHLIPTYIGSGSATLVGPNGDFDKMTLVTSASVYNVRNATCWPVCLNCGGLVSISVSLASSTIGGNGDSTQATATVVSANGTNQETSGPWSSSDSSAATVTGSGVVSSGGAPAPDQASISYSETQPPGTYQCFYSESEMCADQVFEGSAEVSIAPPVINSISGSPWPIGTTSAELGGQYLGTAGICQVVATVNGFSAAATGPPNGKNEFAVKITVPGNATHGETVGFYAICGGNQSNTYYGTVK